MSRLLPSRLLSLHGHMLTAVCLASVLFASCLEGGSSTLLADEPKAAATEKFSIEQLAFFEKRIRPILVEHCYECHSAKSQPLQGALRVDSLSHLRAGGDLGPAVDLQRPEDSLLLKAVRYEGDLQMPPAGKLSEREIRLLQTWIRQGAPMPDLGEAVRTNGIDWDAARDYWAFRPLQAVSPPPTNDLWSQSEVDAYLFAAMQRQSLSPSPPATRRELIRRLFFDLLGLPPTPEQVRRFEADEAPDAWEQLVDRTLASPRFGERWGRYWLDHARYTDLTSSWLTIEGSPFVYRDWVVAALNRDLPYDRFVKYQLAADAYDGSQPQDLAALGFLGLGPTYWKELKLDPVVIEGIVADEWEERVDAVGRTFLGLTIACARCHDHKFDPITSEDYYALAGVFANTRLADAVMLPEEEAQRVRTARRERTKLQDELNKLRSKSPAPENKASRIAELETRLAELEAVPHINRPLASTVTDAAVRVLPDGEDKTKLVYEEQPRDIRMHIRGNPATKGDVAVRRYLTVLRSDSQQRFEHGSGRRDLAEAIFSDSSHLAARVIVNRVWMHHFGRGLVDTPSNFGVNGSRPSHPELLDSLAAELIAHDWSLKWLHRKLLVSAAYRQSSRDRLQCSEIDPRNVYLWRMPRRRLDIESWRDATLAISGDLEGRIGGPPQKLADLKNRRRTIYGLINRRDVDLMLQLHDFPDPTSHSPRRRPTVTPLQQLFVLNSPFVLARADSLTDRLFDDADEANDQQRVGRLYQWLLQRSPEPWEVEAIMPLLQEWKASEKDERQAWKRLVHTLLSANEFAFVD